MAVKKRVLIPAIAAGTVAVGAGAAYYFLKVQPAQEVANPISSFEILPKETLAAGYFSLDENTWRKAQSFGTAEARTVIQEQFEAFKQNLSENAPGSDEPLDFDQDIKPWLGSVTVAGVADSDSDRPSLVTIVGVKDKLEAIKFATRQRDRAEDEVKVTQFKGVDIYEFTGSGPNQFFAILNNHLVLSESKPQVESAIEIDQGAPSLLADAQIQSSIQESLTISNPVAVGFGNLALLAEQAADESTADFNALFGDLQNYPASSTALGIDSEGFRLKSVLKSSQPLEWAFEPLPGKVVSRFPDNTLALVHGGFVQQNWQLVSDQLQDNPDFKEQFETVKREFAQVTKLDLEQDILSWIDGEYGIGLMPASDGLLSQVGFGGAILIQTSDRATAETTLGKLDALAKENGAQVEQQEVSGLSVTQWGIPLQGSLVSHGWLDDSTLLFSFGETPVEAIASSSGTALNKNTVYQATTQSLPKADRGLFYLNLEQIFTTARSSPSLGAMFSGSAEIDPFLNSLKGFAITGDQLDDQTVTSEAMLIFNQS